MKLQKRDEYPFMSLREAMDRLFDESFWGPLERRDLFPKVNVSETKTQVKVTAEVPGMDPEKIEVEADENSLSLSGKIEKEEEQKDERFYRYERSYGEFSRTIPLPSAVEPDKVEAQAKDGVLTVTLPKSKEKSRKKVKVKKESKKK